MVTTLHLILKVCELHYELFTGMNNMLFDGCPLDQYDEDELAKILER